MDRGKAAPSSPQFWSSRPGPALASRHERATELFGIQLPIIQAPMAGVQASALTIAVSQAGGPRQPALRDADAPTRCAPSWRDRGVRRPAFNINFSRTRRRCRTWRARRRGASHWPRTTRSWHRRRQHPDWPRLMPFQPEALEIIAPFAAGRQLSPWLAAG